MPESTSSCRGRPAAEIYRLYGLDKTYQLVPVVSSPEIVASQPTPSKRIRLHEKTPPRLVDKAPPLQDGRDHSPDKDIVLATDPPKDFVNKSSLEFVRTDKDTVLAKDSHTDFVNTCSHEFFRTYNGGAETETVPLTTGPGGFAIAVLENETVTTEVPNLVLIPAAATKPKKPRKNKGAAKKSMKKPAAAKTSMKKQRKKQKVVLCICTRMFSHISLRYMCVCLYSFHRVHDLPSHS